jgi:4-hydroxybenzoate polyprenyltransferase
VLPPLLRASHPGPTLAVTVVAVALARAAGGGWGSCLTVGAAVLAGQLAIGWTNDAHDVARDHRAGRADKPVARGEVAVGHVRAAAWGAGAACVPLSLLLGPAAGLVHLLGVVGSGLTYDLWLKPTRWSWLPFAVAFGLLPAVATLASPAGSWPPSWAIAAGAQLGVAAHLVNTLPDLDADREAGLHGLPHRLGTAGVRWLTAVLLVGAALSVVLGTRAASGSTSPAGWAVAGTTAALAAAALLPRWPSGSRTPFVLVALAAVLDVALLVAQGTELT